MRQWRTDLLRDTSGRAPIKLVILTCAFAAVIGMAAPNLSANPLLHTAIGSTAGNAEKAFSDTLKRATEAMGGK